MSNNHTSIHDFDFTLICNYFKSLERQGPGSPEATQKALSFINELSEKSPTSAVVPADKPSHWQSTPKDKSQA